MRSIPQDVCPNSTVRLTLEYCVQALEEGEMDYEKPANTEVVKAKVAGRDPNEYAGSYTVLDQSQTCFVILYLHVQVKGGFNYFSEQSSVV